MGTCGNGPKVDSSWHSRELLESHTGAAAVRRGSKVSKGCSKYPGDWFNRSRLSQRRAKPGLTTGAPLPESKTGTVGVIMRNRSYREAGGLSSLTAIAFGAFGISRCWDR